ncbi:hypothetical protein JCM11251_004507 [Rhodosporidiobolus azoricus]
MASSTHPATAVVDRSSSPFLPPPSPSAFSPQAVLASDLELHDCPEIFVRDTLKQLAHRLRAGCDWALSAIAAQEETAPSSKGRHPSEPSHLPRDPSSNGLSCSSSPSSGSIPPTHILSLPLISAASCPVRIGVEQDDRLLVPVHALPFSLASPYFAALLQQDDSPGAVSLPPLATSFEPCIKTPPTPPGSPHVHVDDPSRPADHSSVRLPVVHLERIVSPSFALLYDWIYHSDIAALSRALLGASLSPLSQFSSPGAAPDTLPPTPELSTEETVVDMNEEQLEACLDRVQSLWELAMALQVQDRDLWGTMERVWNLPADELEGAAADEEDGRDEGDEDDQK